ncbi:MAG: tRNA lysidine(34) synthetase TilS [Bacillota bacterium]|jgi:tRNA(Ile)-lysidine synthase
MTMFERVRSQIRLKSLLPPGERLVVATSGGPDSVCLLHLLHRLSEEFGWQLVVAHLNHQLRGEAAAGDAAFVQRLAQDLGWPAVIGQADIPRIMTEAGGSVESVSRRCRYQFLRQVAGESAASRIVLGHHQGDQAETVLLHLLRGAGVSGLGGMRPLEEMDGVSLVRPLLQESRRAIMEYLREQRLSFRVDASNAEAIYQRNWLRLDVLPLLRQANVAIEESLARTADLAAADDAWLTAQARQALRDVTVATHPAGITLSVAKMSALPLALQRRALRLVWQELIGHPQNLLFSHVESALELLGSPTGAASDWPLGWRCRRSHHSLVIEQPDEAREWCFELPLPGALELPDGLGTISAQLLRRRDVAAIPDSAAQACCDYEPLRGQSLQVRNWRPGDVFQPLGMAGSKKLQDFFVDQKIDRQQRHRIPLVVSGDNIVWVAGLRLDHRWRVTQQTSQIVYLEYRPKGFGPEPGRLSEDF